MTKRDPSNTRGQAQHSLWGAQPGTHLCALYQGEAELEQIAATFVSSGLAAGDRVLYVASDRPAATVRTALEAHQVATGSAAAFMLARRFSGCATPRPPRSATRDGQQRRIHMLADLHQVFAFPAVSVAMTTSSVSGRSDGH